MATATSDANIKFLRIALPRLEAAEAARLAATLFGIEGEIEPLYGERDQNFRIRPARGDGYVLKIANAAEDPAVVDFQTQALRHIERCDGALPVPRVILAKDGGAVATVAAPGGGRHLLRMLSFLPGSIIDGVPHTRALLRDLGSFAARLDIALRGFFHPAARHELLWDMRQAPKLKLHTAHIADAERRAMTRRVLDEFETDVLPGLGRLRAQVVHNDLNLHNMLVDPRQPDRIAGAIDFGDMVHAPLLFEPVVAADEFLLAPNGALEAVAAVIAGFDERLPLEPVEIELLYDLLLARLGIGVCILAWRRTQQPETATYLDIYEESALAALESLLSLGRHKVEAALRQACAPSSTLVAGNKPAAGPERAEVANLLERRRRLMSPDLPLFYDPPLHLVRGEGVWLYDADSRRYLDVYNNVPNVGHCHPHVVQAIARQAATLNTNTRYLFREVLDYAERLGALMPGDLKACAFVNSGSEAVDLAWRMAKAHTGNGGALTMEDAYHGWTEAVDALSPYEHPHDLRPYVRAIPAPDGFRGRHRHGESDLAGRYAEYADRAIESLAQAGMRPAAFVVDAGLCTNGLLDAPEGYLKAVFAKLRAAGGLCIADEVQAGFGRQGPQMWGFAGQGVTPDIVTLGKPIANGHPIGVVVTSPAIMRSFMGGTSFFSTFGGNTVACAAALATLDVLEGERLPENARDTGAYLKEGLTGLMAKHPMIGEVRGRGLLLGVELVRDRKSREPAGAETKRVLNRMRDHGVLIGSEGRHGNVLKLRPPLPFRREHADMVVDALDRTLGGL